MRIVSGRYKGRIIQPPKNLRARPTTDFAKENLFNVITSYWDLDGVEALDLFSGTGSISYEFASRGAGNVIAVEINAVHYNYIRSMAQKFGFTQLHPVKANAFLYLKSCTKQFDIIFADAPYDIEGSETLPELIRERKLLKPGGWFIFEHSKNLDVSHLPDFKEKRTYGSVNFSIFERPELEQKNE